MGKIKELQNANLDSPERLAKAKAADLQAFFNDEKVAKQIVTAAKRVSKKRAAGEDAAPSPKKARRAPVSAEPPTSPQELEASLLLPTSDATQDELLATTVVSNRAPLVLAFAVTLLKHTMPEQPLSSRLSLAQAYVSTTSRARAVNLGIQQLGRSEIEAEEQLAQGQPVVAVMGKELRVLRRWGYEWKSEVPAGEQSAPSTVKGDGKETDEEVKAGLDGTDAATGEEAEEQHPPLWALDLEALRKSNRSDTPNANLKAGNNSNLPIYTPQSARAYLLKSFDSPAESGKKASASARMAQKERNLGHLLRALDLLYDSWAPFISPEQLDQRTWGWYVKVRPAVEEGVAGWGGKNGIKLGDILGLRRTP